MSKKRCVIVGTGGRGIRSYVEPIATGHLSDVCEMCGLYDTAKARAELCSRQYGNIPVFDDFEEMLDTVKPDFVIVTTKDADHHDYIIRALDKGYDVVSEKPMTNTRKKALAIMEAEKRSGHKVRVTFNMRYMRPIIDYKKVMMSGVIGEVKHVDMEWRLDRCHGADYFRRWHAFMENSNSLLLHKSTHHFDVVNWLIGNKVPKSVFARCTLDFYGKNGKIRGKSCHTCEHKNECPFYWDITKPDSEGKSFDKQYYYDIEEATGYTRDNCVFDEKIDIFDRMSLNVLYEGGITMNYSLIAYAPDEGPVIKIYGTKGRVEFFYNSSGPEKSHGDIKIKVFDVNGNEEIIPTSFQSGDHGGADDIMRDDIFRETNREDPLGQIADSFQGYTSLAIGDMAVLSSKLGREVSLDELE